MCFSQDGDGRTALHQAARYNRFAEARWLLEAGARTDIADFEGLLPLHQVIHRTLTVEGGGEDYAWVPPQILNEQDLARIVFQPLRTS